MDPLSQPNPQQPRQTSRWPFSKNATIIGVVAILAILIIAIVVAVIASNNKSPNQADSNNSALTHDRPGYDRAKLGGAFSDPMALTISANNQAVSYQGQAVMQACNVLTLEDIQSEDLLIKANTLPTPLTRVFNDGEGKGAYSPASISTISGGLGLGMDVNSCRYVIEAEGAASIGVNLFQPFAVSPTIVNQVLQRDYSPAGSIEGLETFKAKKSIPSDNSSVNSEYILRKGNTSFYIAFNLPNDKAAKEQALLTKVAKNFNTQLAQPKGVSTVAYDSPVFTKSYARACDLLTNNDVKQLTGKDAGPLAREGIAPSIAILQFNSSKDNRPYLNITNECTRATTDTGTSLLGDTTTMTVETISFLEDTPAKLWLESQRQANPNNRERTNIENVGDEAVAYIDANGGGNLVFRKGRIAVNVSLDRSAMQALSLRSLNSATSKLTPIAQTMVERVKE